MIIGALCIQHYGSWRGKNYSLPFGLSEIWGIFQRTFKFFMISSANRWNFFKKMKYQFLRVFYACYIVLSLYSEISEI